MDDLSDAQLFAVCLVSAVAGFGIGFVFFDGSSGLVAAIAVFVVIMSVPMFVRGYTGRRND